MASVDLPESSSPPPAGRRKGKSKSKDEGEVIHTEASQSESPPVSPRFRAESTQPRERTARRARSHSGDLGSSMEFVNSGSSPSLLTRQAERRKSGGSFGTVVPTRESRYSALPNEELLLDILDYQKDTAYLFNYLKSEFIDELLDFYLGVDEWRAHWLRAKDRAAVKPKKLRKARIEAAHLYAWYLREGAPRRVNIPGGMKAPLDELFAPIRETIESTMKSHCSSPREDSLLGFDASVTSPSSSSLPQLKFPRECPAIDNLPIYETMFDLAQNTVMDMILIEPFVRFVESDDFHSMMEDRAKRSNSSSSRVPTTRRKKLKSLRPLIFADISQNPDLYKIFETLLKKEFSEEYLYFWAKLNLFAQSKSGDTIVDQAHSIYERYIAGDLITVSITERELIGEKLKNGLANRHIFDLLRADIEGILKTKFFDWFETISLEMKKVKTA